ncbi:S1 family peptidase [Bacillus thuringiensis]|uniref:S1 family peptidase n=1 Tax=Bacillus thuringiensis TaxID=1428 RepID=UPI0039B77646
MGPISASEQLMYSTIRIECQLSNGGISTGSGYIVNMSSEEGVPIPVLVTNKHVIRDATTGILHFHTEDEQKQPILGTYETVHIPDFENLWILHPEEEVDLCVLPLGPTFHSLLDSGTNVYYLGLDKNLIASDDLLNNLTTVEDILMVGYPNGIWDSTNNFPVFRKGITATHPFFDYRGKEIFMIDCACFPGSSGSPVFLFNQGVYPTKDGGSTIGTRVALLGTLFAGPQHTTEGRIVTVDIPTRQVPVPVSTIPNNLGYVIKAKKILDFEPLIKELLKTV